MNQPKPEAHSDPRTPEAPGRHREGDGTEPIPIIPAVLDPGPPRGPYDPNHPKKNS